MTLFDWHNSENAAVNPVHSSGSLNPVIVPACVCGCVYLRTKNLHFTSKLRTFLGRSSEPQGLFEGLNVVLKFRIGLTIG